MKKIKLIKKGRRIVFFLALFLLVFAAASAVKIQAAGNVMGWLWGGTEEQSDGNPNNGPSGHETGVGWVSMNNVNPPGIPTPGPFPYGVTILDSSCSGSGCNVTGYAWTNAGGSSDNNQQNGVGWIDFNPQDNCSGYSSDCNPADDSNLSCTGGAGVRRNGNSLEGCARFVDIARNFPANSGGWHGWIKMNGTAQDGSPYGVDITKMDGKSPGEAGDQGGTYAWSNELGWIDFGQAKYNSAIIGVPVSLPTCSTISLCVGQSVTSCDAATHCATDSSATCAVTGATSWSCTNSSGSTDCSDSNNKIIWQNSAVGECGDWNGCNNAGGTHCTLGDNTMIPISSTPYESTWDCPSQCIGTTTRCSAPGPKSCGWIETNPSQ